MSKRTKLRKRTEPRSLKPILFWVAILIGSAALAVFCIIVYTTSDSPTTTGPKANIAMSMGPFYLIVLLIVAALFSIVMLVYESRRYIRMGRARR